MKNGNALRAIYLSIAAIFVCLAVLVGTTYAWFEMQSVSGTNVVRIGSFDVELKKSANGSDYTEFDDDDILFSGVLMDPGSEEIRYVQVTNGNAYSIQVALSALGSGGSSDEMLFYTQALSSGTTTIPQMGEPVGYSALDAGRTVYSGELGAGESVIIAFGVALPNNAVHTGQSVNFTLVLAAEQVRS